MTQLMWCGRIWVARIKFINHLQSLLWDNLCMPISTKAYNLKHIWIVHFEILANVILKNYKFFIRIHSKHVGIYWLNWIPYHNSYFFYINNYEGRIPHTHRDSIKQQFTKAAWPWRLTIFSPNMINWARQNNEHILLSDILPLQFTNAHSH